MAVPAPIAGRTHKTNRIIERARKTDKDKGRPTTYCPDKAADVIRQVMEEGVYVSHALKEQGIPKATWYQWRETMPEVAEALQIGRAIGAETTLSEAQQRLEKAESKEDILKADRLLKHAQWYAERAAPDDFADIGARGTNKVADALADVLTRMADYQNSSQAIDITPQSDEDQ